MARISTTAFVRVNTKELREKLEALGFRNNESLNSSPTRSYGLLARLVESKNKYIISLPEESQETTGLFKAEEYIKNIPEIVDCGKDEQLFLSICEFGSVLKRNNK